jgi:hypothetical protein
MSQATVSEVRSIFAGYFHHVFLDEGHHAKKILTLNFQSVAKLGAQKYYIITATPIVNRAQDLLAPLTLIQTHDITRDVSWSSTTTGST